jgi:hypothetical protein
MFKLDTSPTYKWPVEFTTVTENGDVVDNEFIAIFKRMPREQVLELSKPTSAGAIVSLDDLQGLRGLALKKQTDDLLDEIDALIDKQIAVKSPAEVLDNEVETVLRFMAGWDGVEIGNDSSFTPANLRLLIDGVPNISVKLAAAFYKSAVHGDHTRKNSKKPRATGR